MPDGAMKEAYLAGDLADRVRGKGQGELLLVLHDGEIHQLESAWSYMQKQHAGAGGVLDHLRSKGLDMNHRCPGSKFIQKNAGNFFKRAQEYGRRKEANPSYLALEMEAAVDVEMEASVDVDMQC